MKSVRQKWASHKTYRKIQRTWQDYINAVERRQVTTYPFSLLCLEMEGLSVTVVRLRKQEQQGELDPSEVGFSLPDNALLFVDVHARADFSTKKVREQRLATRGNDPLGAMTAPVTTTGRQRSTDS